ncbi:MAG TPA: ferredoxin reductase family protein [Candidatus Dormibacteraeota bacterium]|nr:ferredoxin reductase family protein [Candidatus Dormibacteraeota bacterium]
MASNTPAGARAARQPRRSRVLPPRAWPVRAGDAVALVAFNAVLIGGMWLRHGGLDGLGGAAANLTAAGQLTGLFGTYTALIQIVLMSRSPWLEQLFGMDRLAHWHRWLGFSTVGLITAHTILTTVGYAFGDGRSIAAETWNLLTTFPYVLMATVGTMMLIGIAVASMRWSRRRLSYETWHFLHLGTYVAIALGFGHILAVGSDFSNDPWARGYWIALYAVVVALVLLFRVGDPIRLARRHRLRVDRVVREGPGVVSIYVTGRQLDQLRVRAGQFFTWRFLARGGWWRAHPFSLSAAPNGTYLRLTVKEVGDGTADVLRLNPGTPVAVEGPYGIFTTLRRRNAGSLLIAGGIGITPVRALLEELPAGKGSIVVVYRARTWEDAIFRPEIEELVKQKRGTLHYLVGPRGSAGVPDAPFSARALTQLVPDVARRDVFICGSSEMMRELHESLRSLRVPDRQIHYERFALL